MSRWSVRLRITSLVVIVAALLGIVAATIGVSRLRTELVEEAIDRDTAEQVDFVLELATFAEDFQNDPFAGEVAAMERQWLVELVQELDRIGELDEILDALGADASDGFLVLTGFGEVVRIFPATFEVVSVDPSLELGTPGPIVAQATLDEAWSRILSFVFDESSLFDEVFEPVGDEGFDEPFEEDGIEDEVLGEEFFTEEDDFFAEPGLGLEVGEGVDLTYVSTEIQGTEIIVVADVTDAGLSADQVRDVLWLATPFLVVVGGLAAWFLTGVALRPVEAIIQRVDEISGGTLHERVPSPGTGDEIGELAETMNRMLDRLEVDDQRLRQFVSDASHELRSPVAVLRSEAEIARRDPDSTSVDELAEGVLGESRRLQTIVEDLLVLARGEERGTGPWVAIDLDDVVFAEADRRRRVPVDVQSVSAGRVTGNREGCSRMLTHLLDNAARHAESRVAVGLLRVDGRVVLTVDDDGPGVAEKDRQRIFERFVRLDDARSRDRGGAGLGLAVVAETVRSMGGEVRFTDSPLGGARVLVELPAVLG